MVLLSLCLIIDIAAEFFSGQLGTISMGKYIQNCIQNNIYIKGYMYKYHLILSLINVETNDGITTLAFAKNKKKYFQKCS